MPYIFEKRKKKTKKRRSVVENAGALKLNITHTRVSVAAAFVFNMHENIFVDLKQTTALHYIFSLLFLLPLHLCLSKSLNSLLPPPF